MAELRRRKVWRRRRLITEHAFDKLRLLDCAFAEFEAAVQDVEIIDETVVDEHQLKQLVLVVDWVRPLHVIVVEDHVHDEDRVVTVYEPDPNRWSADYRRRR